MKKRNDTLDLIRGIAILVVITGHALLSVLYDRAADNWLYQLIISFQMALLMFVSGISAGYSFPSEHPGAFLRKKTMRLFVPYVCWTVLYTVLNTWSCGKQWNIGIFWEAFYDSEFWFLRFLFLFYVVLAIVNAAYQVFHKKAPLPVWMILSAGGVYVMTKIPYLNKSVSVWYYLWFLAGLAVYSQMEWIRKNTVLFHVVGVGVLDVMAVMQIAIAWRGEVRGNAAGYVWVIGVCYLCYFLKKILPASLTRGIADIGKNTLPVYAVHWCLLFAPWHNAGLWVKFVAAIALPDWILVTGFFLYLLLGTLAITWLLKKFKVTRVLLLGENR